MQLKEEIAGVLKSADDPVKFALAVDQLKQRCDELEPGAVRMLAKAGGATAAQYLELGRSGVRLVGEVIDLVRRVRGDAPPRRSEGSPTPSAGTPPTPAGSGGSAGT